MTRGLSIAEPTGVGESNRRSNTLKRRFLFGIAHCFELVLVAAIAFVGFICGLSSEELLQHAFLSISTISLVHCVSTVRCMNERISLCGEFKDACIRVGRTDLAMELGNVLHDAKDARGFFFAATALNSFFWICGSSCYVVFLAKLTHKDVFLHIPNELLFGLSGLFAGLAAVVAIWKVLHISWVPTQLSVDWLIDRVQGGPAGGFGEPAVKPR